MGAYGTTAGMDDLLKAMRDKALQDTTNLGYLRRVEITSETLGTITGEPSIFLVPKGSPEEQINDDSVVKLKIARHIVDVMCVTYTMSPHSEDAIIGTGKKRGIVPFVDDVLAFYGGNTLSVTGLDFVDKPTIEAQEDAYGTFQLEDEETFLLIATLRYEAKTKPFARG